MRNAVARRPHRERAQPLERRRLGLLEKHKDYSMRAKDFNKKKAQLKSLRQKAAERNEDEFYFGMMSRKGAGTRIQNGRSWTGTIEGDRGNTNLDVDAVRLLKTQDIGYVRTMRQVAAKQVAQLEEQLVLTKGFGHLDEEFGQDDEDEFDDLDDDEDMMPMPTRPKAPRKIVFVDDAQEQEDAVQDHLDQEDKDDEFEGFADGADGEPKDVEAERVKSVRSLQRELDSARKKLKTLTDAENALGVQRAKMAKTATSGGETRRGKKIMVRTRKR
jgi:U3 small nucleolar RNA-associated protein 11